MRRQCVGVFVMGLLLSPWVLAKPLVLSSLKPLTLIAQEVAGESADVDTLLPVTASHHDYPLKVSDYARIQRADIFLWIGPELESFLQKPLANLPAARVIGVYGLPNIHWPKASFGVVEQDEHGAGQDPHLWLNPQNALVVARAVALRLSEVDAAHAVQYQHNLDRFSRKLSLLDERMQASLKPYIGMGFVVYHDGFSHFVDHYGLMQLDYIAITPERKSGAKHLYKLRERAAQQGRCLFLEPYGDMQSARDLAREIQLNVGSLDLLGVRDTTSYEQLIDHMAKDFADCMQNTKK
jgi:zinc transport system substrate-binding protein